MVALKITTTIIVLVPPDKLAVNENTRNVIQSKMPWKRGQIFGPNMIH